ncbi:hypothetical protein JCM17960_31960 [Magnetospira thiophila]
MKAHEVCLGVLTLGEASGYEIRKQFEDGPFAYFHEVSLGSIYPALSRLNADGLVSCVQMAQDGRPDKKVYAITEAGRAHFKAALNRSPARDSFRSEASFMLFFSDLLSPAQRVQVYDFYLGLHQSHINEMLSEDCGQSLKDQPRGRQFVHGLGLAVYRAIVDYMESQRDVLLPAEGNRP